MNGYAKNELWVCCAKSRLIRDCPWSENCPIVGNALPKMLLPPNDGKEISAFSMSCAVAVCVCRPVRDAFWTRTGNPHDMGTRLAFATPDIATAASKTNVSIANFFII